MQQSELKELVQQARIIARRAGTAILEMASSSMDVKTKPDNSPVTEADRTAHKIITTELAGLSVSLPMISEESYQPTSPPGENALPPGIADPFWLIDPLDGTKEYIKGLSEYTVNIALIQRGRPIMGIVYAPALDTLYHAVQKLGAWKETNHQGQKPISPHPDNRPLVAVASRSHSNPQTETLLKKLNAQHILSRGSSIKMCAIAEGQADIYPRIGPTHLWDTAAGTAIAREAGCLVLNLEGRDLRYDLNQGILHPGFVVVPKNKPELVERVKSILA